MVESSKKCKGSSSSAAAHRTSWSGANGASPAPNPPSLSSSTLFSSDEQHIRYSSLFQSRQILDPKYLDLEFFDGKTFDCYQVFQKTSLIPFMSLKLQYYPELVRVFYSNLKIQDGTLIFEVHRIPMIIDESLFFSLTQLHSQGAPFEGTLVDD